MPSSSDRASAVSPPRHPWPDAGARRCPGLLLAGQDMTSPGVEGAFMGGLLAAASVEPSLWARLRD